MSHVVAPMVTAAYAGVVAFLNLALGPAIPAALEL